MLHRSAGKLAIDVGIFQNFMSEHQSSGFAGPLEKASKLGMNSEELWFTWVLFRYILFRILEQIIKVEPLIQDLGSRESWRPLELGGQRLGFGIPQNPRHHSGDHSIAATGASLT